MKLSLSPQAEADLEEIGDFIALDNPSRAVSFVQELKASCTKLETFPLVGVERPELAKDSRMLVHKKYLIFYYVAGDELIVDRFLRGDVDLESVFEKKKEKSPRLPRKDFKSESPKEK